MDTIPLVFAPSTLRIPISLVLCSAVNADKPKRPRQEMRMARPAKIPERFPISVSLLKI